MSGLLKIEAIARTVTHFFAKGPLLDLRYDKLLVYRFLVNVKSKFCRTKPNFPNHFVIRSMVAEWVKAPDQ